MSHASCEIADHAVLGIVADQPDVEHFVLIGTAINAIDASALETLESLYADLQDANVQLHLAAIKGPVMDRLRCIGFADHVGESHFYESTHDAMKAIGCIDNFPETAQFAPRSHNVSRKMHEPNSVLNN